MFDSLLGLILGCLVPCLGYYSSDSSFLFFKGEFTPLRKAPDISGSDSSAVISLCVFFAIFLQHDLLVDLVGARYHKLILLFKIELYYFSAKIFFKPFDFTGFEII